MSAAPQRLSRSVRVGFMGSGSPIRKGSARFGAGLVAALRRSGTEVDFVRVRDSASANESTEQLGETRAESATRCAELLNASEIAVIQHDDGLYGGTHGDELLGVIDRLRVPIIVVVHSVPQDPEPHQRWVLERIAASADRLVVLSEAARERLSRDYAVERTRVVTIPHGGTVPTTARSKRASRPVILTWGMLRPGMGVERVIDAMSTLQDAPGQPRYLVVGPTHPQESAVNGEAYRDALVEQARRLGVSGSVSFDPRFHDGEALTSLIQTASVVALPYDSTEKVTSSVLVDAVVSGRPVVATAFPHALEMLCGGAGILVDRDDPAALSAALRQVLTQPRLAGSMAAQARELASQVSWPVVAEAYLGLAHRVLADRQRRS
ncbi:glycosyltransferase [Mycolicibacterium sp. 3033]|nr:glycosyltransferase [Mycolicibacterium aurantiacum]